MRLIKTYNQDAERNEYFQDFQIVHWTDMGSMTKLRAMSGEIFHLEDSGETIASHMGNRAWEFPRLLGVDENGKKLVKENFWVNVDHIVRIAPSRARDHLIIRLDNGETVYANGGEELLEDFVYNPNMWI